MDISAAVAAVEKLVTAFADTSGRKPREVRVHPSGDDADHIKVWVDLGSGHDHDACEAWAAAARVAAAKVSGPWKVEVRAESL